MTNPATAPLRVTHVPWTEPPMRPQMSNAVDHHNRIALTNRWLERDGRPFIPVSGEIHYSRVPRNQWERRLRLMKAGGITVVSTYVVWIHHQERREHPRFDGNLDLAAFADLCRELDLPLVARIGPWCHGEVRNGGFPDWVQAAPVRHRTDDPAYLALVEPWFAAIGEQLARHCGPDGTVIGIQLENELYDQPNHLLTLKAIARSAGLSAPLWTATAWGGAQLPHGEIFPLFGGYGDGFWVDAGEPWHPTFRSHYFFSRSWDDPGIGADLRDDSTDHSGPRGAASATSTSPIFPAATCELGGGMATAYHRRPRPSALDVAAVSHAKIGNGSAWQGYYMFAGGTNPPSDHGMQESQATGYPNDLPPLSYDFHAPIGQHGGLAPSFAALRLQHIFLSSFGESLAAMPSSLPKVLPSGVEDSETLRWALRSDGESGFVFINWHQPHVPLAPSAPVRFRLQLGAESVEFPSAPIVIPPGTLAHWPVNLAVGGVRLRWATASALAMLDGAIPTLVLAAEPGVAAEIAFGEGTMLDGGGSVAIDGSVVVLGCVGRPQRVRAVGAGGAALDVLVLDPMTAGRTWLLETAHGSELILSDSAVWVEGGALVARGAAEPVVETYRTDRGEFERLPMATASPGEAMETRELEITLTRAAGASPASWGEPRRQRRRTSTGSPRASR